MSTSYEPISAEARAVAGLWFLEQHPLLAAQYETHRQALRHAVQEGTLRMRHPCSCVLGLVLGCFSTAMKTLGLSLDDTYLLGFHAIFDTHQDGDSACPQYRTADFQERARDWRDLQQAWEQLLMGEQEPVSV